MFSPFVANLVDCRDFSGADDAKFFEDIIAAEFANNLVCGVINDNLAAQRDRVRGRKVLGCPVWDSEKKCAPAWHFSCYQVEAN
jgi:hypothetical protein